jgi:MinD superfamily P-loop ATPase
MKGKFVNNLQVILKTLSNFNIIENIDLNKLNIEDIKVPDLAIEKESETLNKTIPIERQPIILKYVVNVLHKFSTVPQ